MTQEFHLLDLFYIVIGCISTDPVTDEEKLVKRLETLGIDDVAVIFSDNFQVSQCFNFFFILFYRFLNIFIYFLETNPANKGITSYSCLVDSINLNIPVTNLIIKQISLHYTVMLKVLMSPNV